MFNKSLLLMSAISSLTSGSFMINNHQVKINIKDNFKEQENKILDFYTIMKEAFTLKRWC